MSTTILAAPRDRRLGVMFALTVALGLLAAVQYRAGAPFDRQAGVVVGGHDIQAAAPPHVSPYAAANKRRALSGHGVHGGALSRRVELGQRTY